MSDDLTPYDRHGVRARYLMKAASAAHVADPLAALAALRELQSQVESAVHGIAMEAITEGATHTAIGQALGISRQAASKKYPRK